MFRPVASHVVYTIPWYHILNNERAILYCVLFLIGLHLAARGLGNLDVVAHFFLITLMGTTLILPIGSFYILNKETKGDTVLSKIIKAMIFFLVVYLSFLLDNNFNEHTDQVGSELGKLSLIAGIVVVCILFAISTLSNALSSKKKNEVKQNM